MDIRSITSIWSHTCTVAGFVRCHGWMHVKPTCETPTQRATLRDHDWLARLVFLSPQTGGTCCLRLLYIAFEQETPPTSIARFRQHAPPRQLPEASPPWHMDITIPSLEEMWTCIVQDAFGVRPCDFQIQDTIAQLQRKDVITISPTGAADGRVWPILHWDKLRVWSYCPPGVVCQCSKAVRWGS